MVRSSPEFFRTYTYDALGQLLTETRHDEGIKVTNTYNHLGNIRTRLVENSTTGADLYLYTYNYAKDTDAGWNYLLTSIVTQDYINNVTTTETVDYDQIGNPTSYRGATLAFNGRQLTSYTKGSNAITYKYDASGLRASKTVNGGTTTYQYVGDKLYFEQRADGSKLYYFYDSYGNLTHLYYHVGETKTPYNVVTNSQGDVIAIYNWNGNQLVASYSYDAWGNCTITQDTTGIGAINPIRYRGYYFDSEIGMYYLQSRYYDPNTGRFINADDSLSLTITLTSITDKNLFAYCDNNPVTRVDLGGNFWDTVFDVVSLVVSVVEVAREPEDIGNWIGLAADTIDLIPFVTGVGETVRVIDKSADVVDAIHDTSKVVDNAEDTLDTICDVSKKTDFFVTPNGEILPANISDFNTNLSHLDVSSGKYMGIDRNGPIRVRPNEIHENNPLFTGTMSEFHDVEHFHIDRRINGDTGQWVPTYTGSMGMFYK